MSKSIFGKRKKAKLSEEPVVPAVVVLPEPSPLVNGHARKKYGIVKSDRLPPYSEEMERGVLGCILLSPMDNLGFCVQKFPDGKGEFYDLRHQVIYDTMMEMYLAQEPVDIVTLYEKLKRGEWLEDVGGISYLSDIQDKTPSAANFTYYADVVHEKHLLRKMIAACTLVVDQIYNHRGEVDSLLDQAERDVLAVRRAGSTKRVGIKNVIQGAINKIEAKFNSKGAISGLSTGFPDLDYFTDGLVAGELIVPAAFPGDGKTSLVMNFAEHIVLNLKLPVAVFSLEMASESLAIRLLCSVAKVNLKKISHGEMVESDFPKLTVAAGRLSESGLHLVEDCDSIPRIVAESRRLKQEHDIKLVVVDYLQLVTGGSQRQDSNREQEVSGAAAALKRLAKELNVPVVAPSQLTDDGKLRESRAIGQHADGVWKLEQEEDDESKRNPEADAIRLLILKNRNGPRGVCVNLTFLKTFTRFESAAKVVDAEDPTKGEPPPE